MQFSNRRAIQLSEGKSFCGVGFSKMSQGSASPTHRAAQGSPDVTRPGGGRRRNKRFLAQYPMPGGLNGYYIQLRIDQIQEPLSSDRNSDTDY
jgi:hypothetical protein